MIKLGSKVRDTISGFEGVVTGRHEYLYGCVRVSVSAQVLHEGKQIETQVFDEPQVELVEEKKVAGALGSGRHGPRDAPSSKAAPKR